MTDSNSASRAEPARELELYQALSSVRSALRYPPFRVALLLAFVIAQSLWVSRITLWRAPYSDERVHMQQIEHYCAGGREHNPRLTMFPGVHVFAATTGAVVGDCSWQTVRRFELVFGLCATALAFALLVSLSSAATNPRTLQFYYLPLAFPFHFFVFTDVPALTFALAALWGVVHRRWFLASLGAAAAVCMRQTNIVVPLLIVSVAWIMHDKSGSFLRSVIGYLRKVWLSAVVLAAFALFAWYNGGVAVGDRARHQVGFHVANTYWALALLFFVSLPSNLENMWKRRSRLRSVWFLLALALAYLVYMQWFEAHHRFNMRTGIPFLRNQVLHWVQASTSHKSLFFIPIAFGIATVCTTSLISTRYWPLYALTLLMLVPESLVESRYAMLPIAFWLLLRRDCAPGTEWASALSNGAISLWLIYQVMQGTLL